MFRCRCTLFYVSVAALIVMIMPSATTSAAADVPPGRIFYAPFEDSLDAAEARGTVTGEAEGTPVFTEGRFGRGIEVGDMADGAAGVYYATEGNFDMDRGSLAMWVKPVNWSGADRSNFIFFNAWPGEKGLFSLYKYSSASWGLAMYLDPGLHPRNRMYVFKPVDDWEPGQWHHIACTWSRHEAITLYINGEMVKQSLGVGLSDEPLQPRFRIGSAWQRNEGRTVIDDVMIFDRNLAPHEIAALAGVEAPAPAAHEPRDVEGILLAHAYLGQQALARIHRDAVGAPLADSARLTLTLHEEHEPLVEERIPLEELFTQKTIDLTGIPYGLYVFQVELYAADRLLAVENLEISKETDATWETAAAVGTNDTVLPPFTPLEVDGTAVECFGRRYAFAGSGLPEHITTREEAILAAPVRLVTTTADGPVDLKPGACTVQSASDVEARLAGEAAGAALNLSTEVQARYDGTIWTTMTITPQQALQVENMRVDIPLTDALARYISVMAPYRVDAKRWGYGAVPEGQGVVWNREFMPSLWLGTEDLGLGWYCESDQYWDIDGEEALTLTRDGETLTLSMNIIRTPRELTAPITIEFGLQATPVRPLAADWRSYQWLPSAEITDYFLHLRDNPYPRAKVEGQTPRGRVAYLYAYHHHFTSTFPKDPEEFREMISRVREFGLLGTPYTDTMYLPENMGDFLLNADVMPTMPGARAMNYGPVCNIDCCYAGPFGDWFTWYVSHLAEEYNSNGIYLDDMWPYGCSNAAHGCGYELPDGTRRVTYPVRARNESYRRLRQMFTDRGEPFHISYHISAGRTPPLPTFGDSLLLAEDRYHNVRENPDYVENITLEELRASYATEAWGIPVVFLPQFKMSGEWMRDPRLAEIMMSTIIPHDIMVWPIFSHLETVMRYRDALMAFGIGEADVRFLPYWEQDTGVDSVAENVITSAYLRPGELLITTANRADETAEGVRISVDSARLGLADGVVAQNVLSGENVEWDGETLVVDIPGKTVVLVRIGLAVQ